MLNPSARPSKRSNHPRQSSGVYNTFSSKQIQGFKEAFSMMDEDNDGYISESDLKIMLTNLGQPVDNLSAKYFEGNSEKGINFTQFLTMFGEHLDSLDDASVLIDAFECFDEKDVGWIDADEIRSWLSSVGDRMNDQEIDRLLSGPFMDRAGKKFNYKAFVEAVKMAEPAELE
ncbi:unnamed protein product [Sympodiomycopsis kandeliae]